MTFSELTPQERLALAALSRAMVRLDRNYSDEESERLHRIAEELGDPEGFWDTLEQAEQTVTGPDHLRAIALAVTRAEARTTILEALEGLAAAEAASKAEQSMLTELRGLWAA
jgi:hypothetical protein